MRKSIAIAIATLGIGGAASGATLTQACTATIQGVGACSVADNGKAGVLIAFWASAVDDAPADVNIASNAADLRDAICLNFGVPTGTCTKEAADGALRKFLETMVKAFRASKTIAALPAQASPLLDNQGNP